MAEEYRDHIAAAAAAIADWQQLWSGLLTEHVAGPDGRCRACTSSVRAAPRWPCGPAALAEAAREIHQSAAVSAAPTAREHPERGARTPCTGGQSMRR